MIESERPLILSESAPSIAHEDRPERRLVNRSGGRLFQRRCSWVNTCAACGQYHGAVWGGSSKVASIEVHTNCACVDIPIEPGEESFGYPPIDEIAPHLSDLQQRQLMGRGNFEFWQSGKVDFSDIVTKRRIRRFGEVASRIKVPKSTLRGSTEIIERNLSNWYRKKFNLSGGGATRAARARMNINDQAKIFEKAFSETLRNFQLTEDELVMLLGKTLTKRILGGRALLSVEIKRIIGPVATAQLFAGELSVSQVADAIRGASRRESAAEILAKLKHPGG